MSAVAAHTETERRIRAVPPPRRVLSRDRERTLTPRQRQILDELSSTFEAGFADLTMAEIASRLGCSLRTLYALAPSRDELVLTVLDRNLWRVGRRARRAIGPDMAPLDAVRAYLRAATVAVSRYTEAFARDMATVPTARQVGAGHSEYLFAVTQALLDAGVHRGEIPDIDTAALARVLANLGDLFIRPHVIPTLRSTPKAAADEVLDVVLQGLRTSDGTEHHDGPA
jgi:AcrR family transcriptional regulator